MLMKYSETGNFTKEQRGICRKLSDLVRSAQKKGLTIKITDNKLRAYLTKEAKQSINGHCDDMLPLKSLSCGQIDVNTSNDYTLYWDKEYIEKEGGS